MLKIHYNLIGIKLLSRSNEFQGYYKAFSQYIASITPIEVIAFINDISCVLILYNKRNKSLRLIMRCVILISEGNDIMTKTLEQKAITLALSTAAQDKARLVRLHAIEAAVQGSMRNPSDSDMDTARIGHSDMMEQAPELYAEWCALKSNWSSNSLVSKQFRSRDARALFNTTYWKNI